MGADTRLLVVGGGQMGLLVAQAARAAGAAVTVAEPLGERRALAEALGLHAVAPPADPLGTEPGGAPGAAPSGGAGPLGRGAEAPTAVLLCTGAAAAWELPLNAVDRGGVIQFFAPAGPGRAARLRAVDDLFFRELEIQASYSAGPRDTREALALIAERRGRRRAADHAPLPARGDGRGARRRPPARGHEGDRHPVRAALLHGPG